MRRILICKIFHKKTGKSVSAEFRNLFKSFQQSAFSDQQEEIDSCIRRNDNAGMKHSNLSFLTERQRSSGILHLDFSDQQLAFSKNR
jgi:hypothetical protein